MQECEVFTIQQSHYIADLTQHVTHLQAELAQLKIANAQLQHEVVRSGQFEEELPCTQAAPAAQVSYWSDAGPVLSAQAIAADHVYFAKDPGWMQD